MLLHIGLFLIVHELGGKYICAVSKYVTIQYSVLIRFHVSVQTVYANPMMVNFSSCQRNLIKTFHIEGMIALITKMTLIFSSNLLNGQK